MFIDKAGLFPPSSVGATSGTFRSYGAWRITARLIYKHSAPTEPGRLPLRKKTQTSRQLEKFG